MSRRARKEKVAAAEQLPLLAGDDYALTAFRTELADLQWDFRTVPGMARALGWSEAAVERLLDEHPKVVRWIPARKNGQQLFVDAARKRSRREFWITIRAYAAKEITDYWEPATT